MRLMHTRRAQSVVDHRGHPIPNINRFDAREWDISEHRHDVAPQKTLVARDRLRLEMNHRAAPAFQPVRERRSTKLRVDPLTEVLAVLYAR